LALIRHPISPADPTAEVNPGKVSVAWIPATDRLTMLMLGQTRLSAELDDFRLPMRPWWCCWIGSRSRKNYATKLRKQLPCHPARAFNADRRLNALNSRSLTRPITEA